ncbi:MAG: transcription-repair coupling factor [Actinomycetota bacterium]
MNRLLSAWDGTGLLEDLLAERVGSVAEVVRPFTVAGLAQRVSPVLVVLPRSREAHRFAESLRVWLDEADVVEFPGWEVLPGEAISPTLATMGRRIKVLSDLAAGQSPPVIVTSVRGVMQAVAPPPARAIELSAGSVVGLDETTRRLVDFGFERNYLVERPGEFSVRGGLLDIFPPDRRDPVRAEFFGDEIDQLRSFSVSSQRSTEPLQSVSVIPCRELLLDESVRGRAQQVLDSGPDDPELVEDLQKVADGVIFSGMEAYLALLSGPLKALAAYLPQESPVVVCDPKQCLDRGAEFLEQAQSWASAASADLFVPIDDIVGRPQVVELWSYSRGNEAVEMQVSGWDEYVGRVDHLAPELGSLIGRGASVMVAAGPAAARARDILGEAGLGLPIAEPEVGRGVIVERSVDRGFLLRLPGRPEVAVVGEHDLFGRRRPVAPRGSQVPARASALVLELASGDYVVHDTYGVGRYHGMVTREVAGVSRDYLVISYASGDKLYLPTEQLEAITKYSGGDAPKLNRLGTAEWEKSKSRARKAVKDIAGELISLYQARVRSEGYGFSPDTPWQSELENAFVHVETPDQMRAIEAVKQDMEAATPMDRLVCGDVGYGKTEVAVRAAFKAVQDSRQAAVLVPTTILAQQHYQTFSDRFAGYPVKVAQLSRFLTPSQQAEVLEGVAAGRVDVVVGTHRLLQSDVKFHDLGLLVVDEEQRFGVKHKEKIKQLRHNVDVLTMTATPIPRTLEMGVTGIRDLSLIDTPPLDRYPVMTFVGDYDSRMVRAAIRRELARDGQVFFVHNRVGSINAAARRVAALVPGARVATAHGRMSEAELEEVMVQVWDGKIDILVCTTIIESGLDIPAMNTLIVERADLLGLSQLYQLRGRVGRAAERAYAYFFYPHEAVLTDEAHERLKILSEFTELGSGFKIALRDLEMRGAGNLLGGEQSGHIAAVGFDLYIRMMSEAVEELTGRKPEPKLKIKLDLPADAFIPAEYIARESLRMEAYRQIEQIRSAEDVQALHEELRDRYGPVPDPVANLLTVAQLRAYLAAHGVEEAGMRNGIMKLKPFPVLADSQQVRLARKHPHSEYKESAATLLLRVPAADVAKWVLETLRDILDPK